MNVRDRLTKDGIHGEWQISKDGLGIVDVTRIVA